MKVTAQTLAGFSNSCLRKNYDQAVDTPEFHMEWWQMVCSDSPKVAIAAPRRHAKSTAITHAYTLACILFRERSYAIIVSSTYTQACQFLGDIKKELIDNEDIQELFNLDPVFVKETEDDIIMRFNDGALFRIQARGAEQKPRGLKWNNKRPDLLVGDDMEDDEMVTSQDRRLKFMKAFYAAWVPAMASNGVIRIVGTILHLDSFLSSLMPERVLGPSRRGKLIRTELKEYTTARTTWLSAQYKAHNEDMSEILWPEAWSKQRLTELREDYIRQGIPDVYSQEMLNEPLDAARTFFKRQDFGEINKADRKLPLNYYITCDLAISSKQRADYTVFTVGGVDEEGVLQIRNVIRDRMDGMEIVETILSLNKLYKPKLIGLEDGQISKSLLPYLNETMVRRNEFAPIQLLKTTQDKMSRAQSIQARMRAGGVKFDKDAEWYFTFEEELLKFPRDRHDDQVDSFAHLGALVDRMYDHETEEELAQNEYDEMVQKESYTTGRSGTTGY